MPSWVIVRIAAACALADRAEVSENGAIPPLMWQPAHLVAKIGATSVHVGVATWRDGAAVDVDPCRASAPTAPAATAAATTAATRRRFGLTDQRVAGRPRSRRARATLARSVGSSIETRQRPGAIRFVPARWLVLLLTAAGVLLRGGSVAKLGVAGLVWSFTPRPLKIAVAGAAAASAIVVLGSLAAITLLILQIS